MRTITSQLRFSSMQLGRSALIILFLAAACHQQPVHDAIAKVMDIFPRVSLWHANEVIVTVQTVGGLTGTKAIVASAARCKVGDRVKVHIQGISLSLDEHACP